MIKYIFTIPFILAITANAFAINFIPMTKEDLNSQGTAMVATYNIPQSKVNSALEHRELVIKQPNDCNTLYNYARRVYMVARTGIYKLKGSSSLNFPCS